MPLFRVGKKVVESPSLQSEAVLVRENVPDPLLGCALAPSAHGDVVELPCTPPRGPSPRAAEIREMVALTVRLPGPEIVRTGDHHDPRIIAILLEHRLAERKEGRVRNAIVFQDNRRLDLGKYPVESRGAALAAS